MAFVLSKSASYFWPVPVSLPASGGKFEKQTFEAEFKRIPHSRVKQIIAGSDDVAAFDDVQLCREVVVGWKGVQDSDRNEIPFSESALNELLEVPSVPKAVVIAFLESLTGAPRKN